MTTSFRRVERFDATTKVWRPIEFEQLQVGDLFRLFEPNGAPVLNSAGAISNRVTTAPRPVGDDGNWIVDAEPAEPYPTY